jgi:type I restriction enzyme, S subunit
MSVNRKRILAEDFCLSVRDGTHDSPKESKSGKLLVTSKNLISGRLDLAKSYFISIDDFNEINKRSKVDQWDVLISMIGTVGEVTLIKHKPDFAIKNVGLFKCKNEEDGKWLYYYLSSKKAKDLIFSNSRGTTQSYIPLNALRKLSIEVPNSDYEKKAIAHILGTLDDKIELLRQMNETLEAMARALFQSWFVDFDPVRKKADGITTGLPKEIEDLIPSEFEDSELGEIPKGWKVGKLGEFADIIDCLHSKKPDRKDFGFPFLQLNNISNNGLIDMSDTYFISEEDFQKWTSRIKAIKGDCVITNVGRVGAAGKIPDELECALGRNITGIRTKQNFPYQNFIIEYLLSDFGKNEINLNTDTGTILDALNVKSIPLLRIVIGNSEVQNLIEKSFSSFREKMEKNLNQINQISSIRDTLLPKLISGELELTDKMISKILEPA